MKNLTVGIIKLFNKNINKSSAIVRLSLAIFVFTFAFIIKGLAYVYKPCADVLVTSIKGNDVNLNTNTLDVKGNLSTESDEIEKSVQNTSGYILNLLCRYTYTTVETRHFLDSFFLSFFAYYSTRHFNATDNYVVHDIATGRALKVIYPYHSFW
jgi:hypothetical protein